MSQAEYDRPLNNGELADLCDQYVMADLEGVYGYQAIDGFTPIVDAESELICYAPTDKAKLMARLLNSYEPPRERPE
jgi:hypothetical protein